MTRQDPFQQLERYYNNARDFAKAYAGVVNQQTKRAQEEAAENM
jgi:hypothetical protein